METDIWGQLALEASQVYLTDGVKRSPFADTVRLFFFLFHTFASDYLYMAVKILWARV